MKSGQPDLFAPARQPVLVAWGAGVDSTSMIIELVARGEPIDYVLFADTGSEHPETYDFISEVFALWLKRKKVPLAVVKYQPKNFKNYPPYSTLEQNCLSNGTLPSKAFGFGSCSQKWKASPQDAWTRQWRPAIDAWAAGVKVQKLIGYDCSPQDSRRYAEAEGYTAADRRYDFRYPLREWGWKREDCIARIRDEGLPAVRKSSCWFCPSSKCHEVDALPKHLLRRIVLMEARAKPRVTKVDGLWRKPIKGARGATPRPGSMTEYIAEKSLLAVEEINAIADNAPTELVAFQKAHEATPIAQRPHINSWLDYFDRINASDQSERCGAAA